MNGRRVGRQAAMMAMVSSRYDQRAASVLSQVESKDVAAASRVESRTMEMMQVLVGKVSQGGRSGTTPRVVGRY